MYVNLPVRHRDTAINTEHKIKFQEKSKFQRLNIILVYLFIPIHKNRMEIHILMYQKFPSANVLFIIYILFHFLASYLKETNKLVGQWSNACTCTTCMFIESCILYPNIQRSCCYLYSWLLKYSSKLKLLTEMKTKLSKVALQGSQKCYFLLLFFSR